MGRVLATFYADLLVAALPRLLANMHPCILRQVLTALQQFVHLALPNSVVAPISAGGVIFCF